MWGHTCSFDHPKALPFYQRSGFKPYQVMVEVHRDRGPVEGDAHRPALPRSQAGDLDVHGPQSPAYLSDHFPGKTPLRPGIFRITVIVVGPLAD